MKDSPGRRRPGPPLEQELHPPENRTHFVAKPPTAYRHDPAQGFVNERQMRVSAATLAYGPNPDGSNVIPPPGPNQEGQQENPSGLPLHGGVGPPRTGPPPPRTTTLRQPRPTRPATPPASTAPSRRQATASANQTASGRSETASSRPCRPPASASPWLAPPTPDTEWRTSSPPNTRT